MNRYVVATLFLVFLYLSFSTFNFNKEMTLSVDAIEAQYEINKNMYEPMFDELKELVAIKEDDLDSKSIHFYCISRTGKIMKKERYQFYSFYDEFYGMDLIRAEKTEVANGEQFTPLTHLVSEQKQAFRENEDLLNTLINEYNTKIEKHPIFSWLFDFYSLNEDNYQITIEDIQSTAK